MADADRTQNQHLTMLSGVAATPKRYGVFPVLRGVEARAPHLPRIGQSKRPDRDIVTLYHESLMGFAEGAITGVTVTGSRARIEGVWMGLTGPMGPLPTHLSEFAFYEKRYAQKHPFNDWLNVLSGRMLQFFYRAWADSQPAALADRAHEDVFASWLSALSGAGEGSRFDTAFTANVRAHYCSVFAGSRSAVAIEDAMTHLLGQKVTLEEFQGRWRVLEPEDQSRLGRQYVRLGKDVVLGRRVRSASDAFRVVVRASNYNDYLTLLPTGRRFATAAEALDAFKPSHLEWDIALELADSAAPRARLDGRAPLGWASWIKPSKGSKRGRESIRADAHLRRIRRRTLGE